MGEKNFRTLAITLLILALLTSVLAFLKLEKLHTEDRRIDYGSLQVASALAERKLFDEAATEYEKYLGRADISQSERKNVLFAMGDMMLVKAEDYRRALEIYTRILALYPELPIKDEINRKVAECLSHLGRSVEADHLVQKAVATGTAEANLEKKVARIGDTFMTLKELEEKVANLPDVMRQRPMKTPQDRYAMLFQVLQQVVIKKEATALDIRNKPEFQKKMGEMEDMMMRQYVLTQQVLSNIKIDDQTIKYYYQANLQQFRDPSRFTMTAWQTDTATEAVELAGRLQQNMEIPDTLTSKKEIIAQAKFADEIAKHLSIGFSLQQHLAQAKKDDIAGPFETEQGHWIFKINDVVLGPLHPLQEVKELVRSRLLEEKQQQQLMDYFQKKFNEYGIRIYEESLQ